MNYCDGCSKGTEKELTNHKAYYGVEYELCDTCLRAYEYMAKEQYMVGVKATISE